MKLRSLTVKSFRIHKETRIEFDERITLISGPNECGKSTLLEALEKAFFLRARGTSADHRACKSTLHMGQPEVEVVFTSGGSEFHLSKSFPGTASGSARLIQSGGGQWTGDEVDEKIASLLGVSNAAKLDAQWSHLFVRQGRSGDDPTGHANDLAADIVRQLQKDGGAAVRVSERDQRIAALFAERVNADFTESNSPKKNSPHAKAQAEADAAAAAVESARVARSRLIEAATAYASALETLARKRKEIEAVERELDEIGTRMESVAGLEANHANQKLVADLAGANVAKLNDAENKIGSLAEEAKAQAAALAPARAALDTAEKLLADAKCDLAERSRSLEAASAAHRSAELVASIRASHSEKLELAKRVEALESRLQAIARTKSELEDAERRLAALPKISAADIGRLRGLEMRRNEAAATLKGMGVRVRVVRAAEPLTVGGEPVAEGAETTLYAEAEILCGATLQLSVSPGAEAGRAEAAAAAEKAEAEFAATLDALGVASVAAAAAGAEQVASAKREADSRRSLVKAAEAERLAEECKSERDALAAASGTLERLLERMPGAAGDLPDDSAAARTLAAAARIALDDARDRRESASTAAAAAQSRVDRLRDQSESLRANHDSLARRARDTQLTLDQLVETFGGEAARKNALAEAEAARDKARHDLEALSGALESLTRDAPAERRATLAAALKKHRETADAAAQRAAGFRALLERDGSVDPETDLARAEAEFERARLRADSLTRKALATRRIHELFQEEKRALSEQFTRPLAEKIRLYLRGVFGAGLKVDVMSGEDRFERIAISRPDLAHAAFAFEQLSGGTREQIAAAARLAIAEILAEDFGGELPVIFDDAFANSDPERVRGLQTMLDTAAGRGLQVVVLTCNPEHYSGLPAADISLPRPASPGGS